MLTKILGISLTFIAMFVIIKANNYRKKDLKNERHIKKSDNAV